MLVIKLFCSGRGFFLREEKNRCGTGLFRHFSETVRNGLQSQKIYAIMYSVYLYPRRRDWAAQQKRRRRL